MIKKEQTPKIDKRQYQRFLHPREKKSPQMKMLEKMSEEKKKKPKKRFFFKMNPLKSYKCVRCDKTFRLKYSLLYHKCPAYWRIDNDIKK